MEMNQLLDTNVILYYLAGRLKSPIPSKRSFVSVITEMELYSYPNLEYDIRCHHLQLMNNT